MSGLTGPLRLSFSRLMTLRKLIHLLCLQITARPAIEMTECQQ